MKVTFYFENDPIDTKVIAADRRISDIVDDITNEAEVFRRNLEDGDNVEVLVTIQCNCGRYAADHSPMYLDDIQFVVQDFASCWCEHDFDVDKDE